MTVDILGCTECLVHPGRYHELWCPVAYPEERTEGHCTVCHNIGWYPDWGPVDLDDAGLLLALAEFYERLGEPFERVDCHNCKHPFSVERVSRAREELEAGNYIGLDDLRSPKDPEV